MPLSLTSTPAVSIKQENKVWTSTGMLVHYLESFTDSLVVTDEKDKPIGLVGGVEIIKGIFENPSSEFFDNKHIKDIMDTELIQVTPETKLVELLEKWKKTRRAYALIPNQYHGYSAISARKLLEIGINCNTKITVTDLPKKNLVTFTYDDTMGEIIHSMFENKTRKLLFKDSTAFISDRIIIQNIAQDMNYLRNTNNFLDRKIEKSFKLADAKIIPENLNISDLSKLMFGMLHPYTMTKDQVYSPWDICMALLSEDISFNF